MAKTPWVLRGLGFGLWTLIGLAFAGQFYISSASLGRPVSWGYAVSYSLCDWYVFALLSVPVQHLARHSILARAPWGLGVVAHLGASCVFSIVYVFLRALLAQAQGALMSQPLSFTNAFYPLLLKTFLFSLLIYWVILAVSHAISFYHQIQDRERVTAELESRLAQARLQALQMQLNPHFLFNTLHAISALMHRNVDEADSMIVRLSDLLRRTLENTGTQEVTLRQELDFLDRYIEIEQARFGNRLTVRRAIEPETLDALVPNLLLQPIVENAIQHGIEPHAKPGIVELRASLEGGMLVLQVSDTGHGMPEGESPGEGVGLSNTRGRLEALYGVAHHLEFGRAESGGLRVKVSIPWRRSIAGAESEALAPALPQVLGSKRTEAKGVGVVP